MRAFVCWYCPEKRFHSGYRHARHLRFVHRQDGTWFMREHGFYPLGRASMSEGRSREDATQAR
jgi:hypothetical protein